MTVEELIAKKKLMKLSVQKLSSLSGVPAGTINKILSGETKNPRRDTMEALEKVFTQADYVGENKRPYGSGFSGQGTYTAADLEKLPDGVYVELIDGYIFDMSAPTIVHQLIAEEIRDQAKAFIQTNRGNCFPILAPSAVFLDDDDATMLLPDFSITCDEDKIGYKGIYGAPDFVLEVLSPFTEKRDKLIKFVKYQEAGVREYWLIDPEKKTVIAYKFFDDMMHRIHPLKGKLGVAIYEEKLMIDLDAIAAIIDRFEKKKNDR